jgi:hypothetical protein
MVVSVAHTRCDPEPETSLGPCLFQSQTTHGRVERAILVAATQRALKRKHIININIGGRNGVEGEEDFAAGAGVCGKLRLWCVGRFLWLLARLACFEGTRFPLLRLVISSLHFASRAR